MQAIAGLRGGRLRLAAFPTGACTAYTVGHFTHELEAFVALLQDAGVAGIADVRRWPRSRHPQFDEALAVELGARGIAYAAPQLRLGD